MTRSLLSMAALAIALAAPANAATVTPPATKFQTSLTKPTLPTGAVYRITKASSVQVSASNGNITFKLKMAGVVDGSSLPVTQTGNALQIDVVIGGVFTPLAWNFNLVDGKTDNTQTKFTQSNTGLGLAADDSIQIVDIRCIQSPISGAGANKNFCVPGLTAK